MINCNIVFILGAGASVPYGLPSGEELVNKIINLCEGRKKVLQENGFPEKDIQAFGKALRNAAVSSIDYFLLNRTEFTQIGKLAIAIILLENEAESRLYWTSGEFASTGRGAHLYKYLFPKLEVSPSASGKGKVTFVTFNYDRSLEQYIYEQQVSLKGHSSLAALNAFMQYEIIHPHGDLGYLPWNNNYSEAENCVPYGGGIGSAYCQAASSNILLIQEARGAIKYDIARRRVREADVICFLGCGYHEENLNRLGFCKPKNNRITKEDVHIYGSSFKMTKAEVAVLNSGYGFHVTDNTEQDSVEFLRHSHHMNNIFAGNWFQ